MSKAILVLDKMPVKCSQCIFDRIRPKVEYEHCGITHGLITNPDEKSDDCPLCEAPDYRLEWYDDDQSVEPVTHGKWNFYSNGHVTNLQKGRGLLL